MWMPSPLVACNCPHICQQQTSAATLAPLTSASAFHAVPSKGSSSGERSWSVEEGGKPDLHPLSDAWSINPADLAVCQLPDGRDWILGTGSFGASLAPQPHNVVVM